MCCCESARACRVQGGPPPTATSAPCPPGSPAPAPAPTWSLSAETARRRYVISAKHLSHPLIAALIDDGKKPIAVNCEVVLFDHLLWMLDNAVDLRAGADGEDDDAMRKLAQLYAC